MRTQGVYRGYLERRFSLTLKSYWLLGRSKGIDSLHSTHNMVFFHIPCQAPVSKLGLEFRFQDSGFRV